MVYRIISADMVRFFMIYGIFVIGFSQAFYVIFLGCHRQGELFGGVNLLSITKVFDDETDTAQEVTVNTTVSNMTYLSNGTTVAPGELMKEVEPENILVYPFESVIRMFIMSVGEFSRFYREMNQCRQHALGKTLFIVFELGVSIMLLNLLIAMMGRTYQEIVETQKEWKRQWAKVILMMEEMSTPAERLMAKMKYSRPIGTDKIRRAFVVKYKQSAEEIAIETEKREKEWAEFSEANYKRKVFSAQQSANQSRSESRADELLDRIGNFHNSLIQT